MKKQNKQPQGKGKAQPLPERRAPRYSVTRWQGGWALWRDDGTMLEWFSDVARAEEALHARG